MRSRSSLHLLFLFPYLLCACDGSPSRGSGTDSGTTTPGSCAPTCESRAASCGAPEAMASAACATLCASGATESELACLTRTPCEELAIAFEQSETVCGIGSGGSDAGTAGSCTPGDPPRCDGNTRVTCEMIGGVPAVVRNDCGSSAECRNGVCEPVAPMCHTLDERDCAPDGTPGPGQCCEGLSCWGEVGPSGETYQRCCIPEGGSCDANENCCGFNPDLPLFSLHCAGSSCVR